MKYYWIKIGNDYYKTAASSETGAKQIIHGFFCVPDSAIEVKEVLPTLWNLSARKHWKHLS